MSARCISSKGQLNYGNMWLSLSRSHLRGDRETHSRAIPVVHTDGSEDVTSSSRGGESKGDLKRIPESTRKWQNNEAESYVLSTLADIYEIDYVQLMELAGYLPARTERDASERHGRVATFAEHNLTQSEEGELLEFLKFIRVESERNEGRR